VQKHEWTNNRGQTIKAEFISATNEDISMQGKTYVLKLADLSPQSRALAAKLRVQKPKAREPQNDQTPLVKTSEVPKIDLDDNETRNKIIAEAISYLKIQRRLENGETASGTSKGNPSRGLLYTGNTRTGRRSCTFKDGKGHGLRAAWYETGQKHWESTYKDGNLVTATAWKPNGEKCPDTNLVDGNGIVCSYHKNGQKNKERTYKDGEEISTKEWDEDGNPK
jgi:hypothetical protein